MKKIVNSEIKLSRGVFVFSDLENTFHFQNEDEMLKWIKDEFPKLSDEYENGLEYYTFRIDILKVGDKCRIDGEDKSIFEIVKMIEEYDHHYLFLLDNGLILPVSSCFAIKENDITFSKRVRVDGDLQSNFVFENEKEMLIWLSYDFPKLKKEYNKLSYKIIDLDSLKIGDECYVIGEGDDIFKIESLVNYGKHKYSFGLSSGWNEEVSKCFKVE